MALALGTLLVLGACGQGGERGDSVRPSAVAPVVVGEQVDAARRRLEAASRSINLLADHDRRHRGRSDAVAPLTPLAARAEHEQRAKR